MRAVQALAEMELPLPDPGAGLGAAIGAAPAVPHDAERRAVRHVELLAGRGRDGRSAELRDHRQAAVCVAGRSDYRRADRGDGATAAGSRSATTRCRWPSSTLLQGLGRLIRHRDDRGVLAVLDPRLQTMGYGRRFLASLPPAAITRDLDADRAVL